VGSAAQLKGMKSVAGSLKSEMAQYASLATFAQFGTDDLDAVTRRQLDRGARLTELLKQNENSPLSVESQVAVIYVANEGALDDVPVEKVRDFEAQWHEYVAANLPEVLKSIAETGDLGEDDKGKLDDAVAAFKQTVSI
jgi:F-type H+-transporting ATPase subunit alpha